MYHCAILSISEMVGAYVTNEGKVHSLLVRGSRGIAAGSVARFKVSVFTMKQTSESPVAENHVITAESIYLFVIS